MSYGSADLVTRRDGTVLAKVSPGNFYATRKAVPILTVLGSCVSACIRDPVAGIGGMNHFMLPVGDADRSQAWGDSDAVNRFGNIAMRNLIDSLIDAGGVKERFEVKLFGGGRVLDFTLDVGARNVEFAQSYLEHENIAVDAMDVGEDYARKLVYEPRSGIAKMKRLRDIYRGYVATAEKQLLQDTKSIAAQAQRVASGLSQRGLP